MTFTKEDYEKLRLHKLGTGIKGTCYLHDKKYVLKEYHVKCDKNYVSKIDRLLGKKYEGFYFPKDFYYVDNKVYGHFCDYADGISLYDMNKNNNLDYSFIDFVEALQNFEENLKFLVKDKIQIFDINSGNIMYTTSKEIVAVDTDEYFISDDVTLIRQYQELTRGFYRSLFIRDFPFYLNENYVVEGMLINGFVRTICENNIPTSIVLLHIKDYYEYLSSEKITTLEDYVKVSKKV